MSEAPVLFEELPAGARKLGRVTLSVAATLNSLTLDMVDLLQEQLDAWRGDRDIAAIFIEGAGQKAFCAGGDVQALHRSATATPGGPCDYAESFFTREYRMNYTLHTYSKPVICWGHGIVMGGGLGVMAGCSHRVVTEKTRIAMPEVTIALFPDVGGSWFLNHMPGKSGQFLALTGASINAADAIYTGMADRFISSERKAEVLQQLLRQEWGGDAAQQSRAGTPHLCARSPSRVCRSARAGRWSLIWAPSIPCVTAMMCTRLSTISCPSRPRTPGCPRPETAWHRAPPWRHCGYSASCWRRATHH